MTELINPIVLKLMNSFPNSFINYLGEFIADRETNQWFRLEDCHTETDVQCKVLEYLSRAACKTQYYRSETKNNNKQNEMRKCINNYLGTKFTADEMMTIYTYLGNGCNRSKTILFIESGYNVRILTDEKYCSCCGQALDWEVQP